VLGCQCFALLRGAPKDKFRVKERRCVFLSYPEGQKAYKLLDWETRKLFISRDVIFQELVFPFKDSDLPSSLVPLCPLPLVNPAHDYESVNTPVAVSPSHTDDHVLVTCDPVPPISDATAPSSVQNPATVAISSQPTRSHRPPTHGTSYSFDYLASLANVMAVKEPTTYKEANNDPLWQELHKAFTIKDLGLVRYFLGLEVSRTTRGSLDVEFFDCKSPAFPMSKGLNLSMIRVLFYSILNHIDV
ncbi:hypothetical protein V2J09_001797, partial [Rumex salicifolius]